MLFVLHESLVAQIDPGEAFEISYSANVVGENLELTPLIKTIRKDISSFNSVVEIMATDAARNQSFFTQPGLVSVPAKGEASMTKLVIPAENLTIVALKLELTHVQEGWSLRDTFIYRFKLSPKPAKNTERDPDFIEIDGLVIDRTITKSGQDFYGLFFRDWQAPFGARSFSIILEESPWRGRQTMIKVSIDDQLIYQRILQPRYDALEEMSKQAIAYAYQTLSVAVQAAQSRDGQVNEVLEEF
ncbi:MAG: CsgE family curli-type amyloid fiber assembly protein [Saprospiraceae bacterium]